MGILVLVVGLAIVVWAVFDIWRSERLRQWKVGWTIVALAGQLTLPGWRLTNGWYAAVPLGALAYLALSQHGPLRRRPAEAA